MKVKVLATNIINIEKIINISVVENAHGIKREAAHYFFNLFLIILDVIHA